MGHRMQACEMVKAKRGRSADQAEDKSEGGTGM